MKKIGLLMVALFMMVAMVMAQGTRRGGDRQMDPKVRAERMTDRMVKEYALNDTQKKQLLEANQAWIEKIGSRSEGRRQDMKRNKDRKGKDCQVNDSCCKNGEKPAPKVSKEEREKKQQEMKAFRDAYNTQLKQILTKGQYEKYVTNQQKRK